MVDASAVLEPLLGTRAVNAVAARLLSGEALRAPHLLDAEVAQVVRRYWRAGQLGAARAAEALADLADLHIERHPHGVLLTRTYALGDDVTAYVALAEALDAPLLTPNRRLAGAAGHGARVEVV